jgi:hypothetical protein
MNSKIKFMLVVSLIVVLAVALGGAIMTRDSLRWSAWQRPGSATYALSPSLRVVGGSITQVYYSGLAGTLAQISSGDRLVVGGSFTLQAGEIQDGNLFILGGAVTLEAGSTVNQDVIMVGGNLKADGKVGGDVFILGGLLEMSESTQVQGDVNVLGGSVEGEELATIGGQITTDANTAFPITIPSASVPFVTPGGYRIPNLELGVNPVWSFLWFLLRSLMWAVLAIVVVLFFSKPTERVARTVVSQPLISGGLGLLTIVVVPVVLVLIAITICGIPIALLAALALTVSWAFGMIVIGTEVGNRLAKAFKADWAKPVSAGLGTFLLVSVVNGAGALVPCVGWVFGFLVGIVGLGAVLLTRFGSQPYPAEVDALLTVEETTFSPVESLAPELAIIEETPVSPAEHPIASEEIRPQDDTPTSE